MNEIKKNVDLSRISEKEKTYLTEENTERLKKMFSTEEKYIEYMQTLWVMRAAAVKTVERKNPEGETEMNFDNPNFRICKLVNDLLGALLSGDLYFTKNGKAVFSRLVNHLSRQISGNEKTCLTEENAGLLKKMFSTEEKYIEYMQTLWVMRAAAVKTVERKNPEGETEMNFDNPNFRICELTNNLIGALLNDDLCFYMNDETISARKVIH